MTTTFVDLFSGSGGLSAGLHAAGWESLLAIDNWSDAIDTYRHNFPKTQALVEDIHTLDEKRLSELVTSPVDWVVGGPPCQGFSTVGKRERSDPRNTLFNEFARVVGILRPRGFLAENVLGLKDMQFTASIIQMFEKIGYAVTPLVVSAADFGVPQLRRRVLFVGSRDGKTFKTPTPILTPNRYVSVWDAIGDLPSLSPGELKTQYDSIPETSYQREMRKCSRSIQGHLASKHPAHLVKAISYIPDGGNRTSIPAKLQPSSGFHNSYSRLDSKAPAVALTQNMGKPSGTRCIHPFQHRGLTAREGARLQSFPDRFHFIGATMSQRLQIANAVPPRLGEALGRLLMDPSAWLNPGFIREPNKRTQAIEAPQSLEL